MPRWPTLLERFESYFIPEPNSGCWLWTGALTRKNGYGRLSVDERTKKVAHRFSWELYNKSTIPDGLSVLHTCDNPACINPDHLFLGTQKDNMIDCKKKGRNAGVKLLVEEAIAIKNSSKGPKELAIQYGMSATHICAIQKGRRRK